MQYRELKTHLDQLERAALGAFFARPENAAHLSGLSAQHFSTQTRGKLFEYLRARWNSNPRSKICVSQVLPPLVETGMLRMQFPARFLIGLKLDHERFERPETLSDELLECTAYLKKHAADAAKETAGTNSNPASVDLLEHPDGNGTPETEVPELSRERDHPLAHAEAEGWSMDDLDGGEEHEALWAGMLAVGAVTLLHSRPKLGKSFTMFGLVKAMYGGADVVCTPSTSLTPNPSPGGRGEHEFLGQRVQPCGVVWLTEESRQTLREKRERFELPRNNSVYFLSRRAPKLAALKFTEALEVACRAVRKRGAKLLIIDTLGSWASLDADAENHAARIEQLFHHIKARAVADGFAALVLHHTEKKGKSARGSTALEAASDSVLRLSTLDKHPNRRAITVRSRLDDAPQRVEFELVTESGVPEFVTKFERKTSHEEVLKWIPGEGPGITVKELSERSGLSRRTVGNAAEALVHHHKVVRVGEGTRYKPATYLRISTGGSIPPTGVEKVVAIGQPQSGKDVLVAEPEIVSEAPLVPPFPQVPPIKEVAAQPEPVVPPAAEVPPAPPAADDPHAPENRAAQSIALMQRSQAERPESRGGIDYSEFGISVEP
jgi:hypothetical protein